MFKFNVDNLSLRVTAIKHVSKPGTKKTDKLSRHKNCTLFNISY